MLEVRFRQSWRDKVLPGYSAKLVAEGGMPIEARVGMNTGEVVVRPVHIESGRAEYTPIGHTSNLAARMQAVMIAVTPIRL